MLETATALQILVLSAQVAGLDTRPLPPPPAPAVPTRSAAEEPRAVLKLSLEEISRDQERAYSPYPVGRGYISFSVGLDPENDLWVKFRQSGRSAAHTLAELSQGVEENFPVEAYRFLHENGLVRAFPALDPQEPQANVSVPALVRRLHDTAILVLLTPIEYAVVYEDGSLVPASVSLIREDNRGRFWVTHKKVSELQEIQWFAVIDAKSYGMRLEGESLVFYSQPSPSLSWAAAEAPLD